MVRVAEQPESKQEYAYNTLRSAILRCQLPPGQRLGIASIASRLGVSPIPVREALWRLQAEGLVEHHPDVGVVVASISLKSLEEALSMLEMLEVKALGGWLPPRPADRLHVLQEVVLQLAQPAGLGDEEWWELHRSYHARLLAATRMPTMVSVGLAMLDRLQRAGYWCPQLIAALRRGGLWEAYEALLQALRRGDLEEAEVRLRRCHRRLYDACRTALGS